MQIALQTPKRLDFSAFPSDVWCRTGGIVILDKEVDYILAKWLLVNIEHDGLLTFDEMRTAWQSIARHYNSPFIELEDFNETIGNGVVVSEK